MKRDATPRASVYDLLRAGAKPPHRDGALVTLPKRRRTRAKIDIWQLLEDRSDVTELRPELAPDIEISEFPSGREGGYAMIGNPRALVHLRISLDDVALLRMMDGTRSVREIVVERFRDSGDMELDGVASLVLDLREGGFLSEEVADVRGAVVRAVAPKRRRRLKKFMKTLTIEWYGADGFVRRLYHAGFRHLLRLPAVIVFAAIALGGFTAFVRMQFGSHFGFEHAIALEGLIVLGLNLLLVFVHELGHALLVIRFGRRIKNAAFQIYFGAPTLLVESSDVLMLDKRRRIMQAAAGAFAESIFAGAASLIAWAFPEPAFSTVLFHFAVLNYFYIFLNLVPLLELDGYWILSDLLAMPDLRPRALAFMRHELPRRIIERKRLNKQETAIAAYGVIGVLFTVLAVLWSAKFWVGLFAGLVRPLWRGGVGTRVLLLVLAAMVLAPLVRGLVRLVRSMARFVRAAADHLRFRMQRRWRIEAGELIDRLPAFQDLPEEVLGDLAGRVKLRTISPGQAVFHQGDPPSSFFVVRSGTLNVIEESPAGERILDSLGHGQAFGELALLDMKPRRATVRAATDSELFEIDKGTFDRLLADEMRAPEFAPTMGDLLELRGLPPFSHLSTGQLSELLSRGEWMTVLPGEVVVKQGEQGDAFYAIAAGQVDVIKGRREVNRLGPGDHFGELALLSDDVRAATVRALTNVRLFRVDRRGFDRLVRRTFRQGRVRSHLVTDTKRAVGG